MILQVTLLQLQAIMQNQTGKLLETCFAKLPSVSAIERTQSVICKTPILKIKNIQF